MHRPRKSISVTSCKHQAAHLLKLFRSSDLVGAEIVAKRFRRLSEFSTFSVAHIRNLDIKTKHAQDVIAIEQGFASWSELQTQAGFIIADSHHLWFDQYAEAKLQVQFMGGFILPYKNQFFVCKSDYIKQLGMDPTDPDWKLIGNDWVRPNDLEAWKRLYKKWMKIQQSART
jgi:hypothetical protein